MKLCLFLTLCLAHTVSSFLYQNSRCHEGPSYWCSDEQVAESCEATTFCRENIWSDQTQQVEDVKGVGNYVTCKACTWTLGMVESYIFTEANEDKVLAFGMKVCDLIPATYTETCKNLIDNYGKEALETLKQKVDPTVLCTALGQCTSASGRALLLGLPKSQTCTTCKETMAELQNQNRELFTWWQNSCEGTGEPAKCVEYSQYAKLLNNAFLNEDICEEMEMC